MFDATRLEPSAPAIFTRPDFHSRILIGLSIADIFGWILCTTFEVIDQFNFSTFFYTLIHLLDGIWVARAGFDRSHKIKTSKR